jgi:uncharacterized membrane protein required for colicin V production
VGTFYDVVLLGILLVFAVSGFRRGIVRSVIELAGFLASLVLSLRLSGRFAAAAAPYVAKILPSFHPGQALNKALSVIVLFAVMEILVHLIASAADHVFRLPVLRQVNALLGGALGLVKGVAVVFVVCALTRLAVPAGGTAKPAWKEIGNSRIFQYAEQKNPVDSLLRANILNGVNWNADEKQKL